MATTTWTLLTYNIEILKEMKRKDYLELCSKVREALSKKESLLGRQQTSDKHFFI